MIGCEPDNIAAHANGDMGRACLCHYGLTRDGRPGSGHRPDIRGPGVKTLRLPPCEMARFRCLAAELGITRNQNLSTSTLTRYAVGRRLAASYTLVGIRISSRQGLLKVLIVAVDIIEKVNRIVLLHDGRAIEDEHGNRLS